MDFDIFDEKIGVDGYYRIIRQAMFPNSTESTLDIAEFRVEERYYPKGSYFSRVRWISPEKANEFIHGDIDINAFYPPRPHLNDIPEGRFNKASKATMYLSDHPFVAMKECEINEGDFFLLSYFSLPRNMCFMYLDEGADNSLVLLYKLFKSRDKRFYPVINLVYTELLNFDKHDGIAYDSTKINDHCDDGSIWGNISSITNFAIQNERIKSFKLEVSWLMWCGKGYNPIQHAMYVPLSNKKRNRISMLNYRDNKNAYISRTNEINARLHEGKRRGQMRIDKGNVKMSQEIPFKMVGKFDK